MNLRRCAIWTAVLAVPLVAAVSAVALVSDLSPDEQADEAMKAKASVPSTWSEPTNTVVEVTIPPASPGAPVSQPSLSANPLWAMPLKLFSATRERPIFLPSRRPPAPPPSVATVVNVVVPKPKEPEQPRLSLVGTIASDEDKFGIFVDQSTKAVLRLRLGEDYQGWKLQSVQGRETTFEKNNLTFLVALPQPGLSQPTVTVRNDPSPGGDPTPDQIRLLGRPPRER